jgi:hypothetical protein
MSERKNAKAEFLRMLLVVIAASGFMSATAIAYLAATGELHLHLVVATLLGVFFSVLLGCGLFALSFFSDKSGYDRSVADATRESWGDDTGRG